MGCWVTSCTPPPFRPGEEDRRGQQGQAAVRPRHLRDGGAHRPDALAAAPVHDHLPEHRAQRAPRGVARPQPHAGPVQRQVPR